MNGAPIPVILFAYARPDHLRRTLECLHANQVPLIYAFSDGPRTPDKQAAVEQVREILCAIDWCELILTNRNENLGLGKSILTGVTETLTKHDAIIVFEDDLICVPGTYQYLSAALEHYQADTRVMSVTGWTHPRVTPNDLTDQPYFDGKAECWVWGTWRRAWQGMECDAMTLLGECRKRRIDIYRYGADLPTMAKFELEWNIWAVRFLYLHILRQGLCFRPPHSLVEHVGYGEGATNHNKQEKGDFPPLRPCPSIPSTWPEPLENPECARLWQRECGRGPRWYDLPLRAGRKVRRVMNQRQSQRREE